MAADSEATWVAVCTRQRLRDCRMVCARVADTSILVIEDHGQIHAVERTCPHEQADLGLGRVADGQLHCPRHQAWFRLADGRISPGWPSRDLRRYPVRLDDQDVWVDAGAVARRG